MISLANVRRKNWPLFKKSLTAKNINAIIISLGLLKLHHSLEKTM
jgi:hypothetical protein